MSMSSASRCFPSGEGLCRGLLHDLKLRKGSFPASKYCACAALRGWRVRVWVEAGFRPGARITTWAGVAPLYSSQTH